MKTEHIIDELFDLDVNPDVESRGYNYYKEGRVTEVTDLGDGYYEAIVEGADDYTVNIHLKNGTVIDYDCDCPYSYGGPCKHVVAALYSIDEMGRKQNPTAKPGISKTDTLKAILNKIPENELQSFVYGILTSDKSLRNIFMAKYAGYLYPDTKELYVKKVRCLIDSFTDRSGYLDEEDTPELRDTLCSLMDRIGPDADNITKQRLIYTGEAIVEEVSVYLDEMYYEDCLTETLEYAIQIMMETADTGLKERLRTGLFEWTLDTFRKNSAKSYFWLPELLLLGIKSMRNDTEKKRLETTLDRVQNLTDRQFLKAELILRTEGKEAAFLYKEKHSQNPEFRKEIIEKALTDNDYDKARKLAEEGIESDMETHKGRVEQWREYLLTVYLKTGDNEQMIKMARHFLSDCFTSGHPKKYYYDLIKSHISKDKWPEYYEDLIEEGKNGSGYLSPYYRLSDYFIWEEKWERLLKLLQEKPEFEHIASAEKYLAKDYGLELARMYRDLIPPYLENHKERKYYQTVCSYIRRMKKLGADEVVQDLVLQLRRTYSNRKALLEELSKI